jgi:hypothetical protein
MLAEKPAGRFPESDADANLAGSFQEKRIEVRSPRLQAQPGSPIVRSKRHEMLI